MENIYEIENLKCSYDKKKVVLHIEQLNIPRGKIVFVVGKSGSGKSTILETLGFMSDTIQEVSRFVYNGNDMRWVWNWSDEVFSDFRNTDFSFIFQQNNLMHNFSAYENVMITAMNQGMTREEAREKTDSFFKSKNLPIVENSSVSSYSGGQRQWIAFARAIIPNFLVLFGDEPTGNLDFKSANELMEELSSIVRYKHSTAIIVSHDIDLAVNHSDMIVQIKSIKREDGDGFYGLINNGCIYNKVNGKWFAQNESVDSKYLCRKIKENL